MGRFKKGLFLGGLIGAGLTWMTTTRKGREVRDELLDHAATIYDNIQKEIHASSQVQKLTKHRYVAIVKKYVDTYAKDNGLSDNIKNMITKLLNTQWKQFKQSSKKNTQRKKKR
jgi:gas vesicle protein